MSSLLHKIKCLAFMNFYVFTAVKIHVVVFCIVALSVHYTSANFLKEHTTYVCVEVGCNMFLQNVATHLPDLTLL
jgi:hypothetical protein